MTEKRESKISRREFVKGASAGALLLSGVTASMAARKETGFPAPIRRSNLPQSMRRPNVIFILADDLGWGDLSCYGRPEYRTPNLDRLALQGTRFTNAYSASCVCTPTRCAFHTGRYPARLRIGLEEPLRGDNNRVGLDPGHPTIASLLQKNGYATALIGKWHLGFRPEWGPNAHGFDEFFGILAGASDYFLHRTGMGKPDLHENLTLVERTGYLTELLTERAVDFISKRKSISHGRATAQPRPFYLSLHYTAPHWPWQGPKGGELVKFSETAREPTIMNFGGSLKLFAEMMRSLDLGIGKVMATVAKAGLDRNTLVIFTSDNGGERFSYQWPLSGEKGDLLEGGIRVPAIVHWPGVVPARALTDQVAITMDWTATILSAAETMADPNYPLDGEDLLPTLKRLAAQPGGQATRNATSDRTLFWRTRREDAVRSGKWKYLRKGTEKFLFDLSVDEREQADFKNQSPDVLNRLIGEFERWERQMLPRPN